MNRVFLGGSRKVSRLNERIRGRLAELVRREMRIVIGDANGADRAMQRQLADWGYAHVVVYHVGSAPRNNPGGWPTCRVPAPAGARGFDFYSAKDRAMAAAADCGLMLWDGASRGTLANVEALTAAGKPVSVYVSPTQRFTNVLSSADVQVLVSAATPQVEELAEMGLTLPLGDSTSRPNGGRRSARAQPG